MKNLAKLVLGAAVLAGAAVVGATPAQAAVRVFVGGPVAYVPPCPGPGYSWAAGYYAGGVWFPGRWNFVGVRGPALYGHVDRFYDRGRVYDRRFDGRRFDGGRFRR